MSVHLGSMTSFLSRVAYQDPDWIRIQSGQWIRIRIRIRNPDPGVLDGKNDPQKLKAEGFFCNLEVLYGGLAIGKL